MAEHFILIRGLIREAAHWGDFLPKLKTNFPKAHFHCIDIPGAGVHYQTLSPLTISGIVDRMREDFLALKLTSPAHLIAISLGGMISVDWMRRYPQDFKTCVLMNTSFSDYSPVWKRLKPSAFLGLLPAPIQKGFKKEHTILKTVSNLVHDYEKNAHFWHSITAERPVSVQNTFRQLLAATTFKTQGFKPTIPALILASTNDRMVNVDCSQAIARRWGVPIYENPTAGHDITLDAPDWVIAQLSSWSPLKLDSRD